MNADMLIIKSSVIQGKIKLRSCHTRFYNLDETSHLRLIVRDVIINMMESCFLIDNYLEYEIV